MKRKYGFIYRTTREHFEGFQKGDASEVETAVVIVENLLLGTSVNDPSLEVSVFDEPKSEIKYIKVRTTKKRVADSFKLPPVAEGAEFPDFNTWKTSKR